MNACSNIEETRGVHGILNAESPVQPITESPAKDNLKDDQIARFVKAFSRPVSEPVFQGNLKDDDTTKRLRILGDLLKDNLITEKDFKNKGKRLREALKRTEIPQLGRFCANIQ